MIYSQFNKGFRIKSYAVLLDPARVREDIVLYSSLGERLSAGLGVAEIVFATGLIGIWSKKG